MINEAFWFFYWVDVCGVAKDLFFFGGIGIAVLLCVPLGFIYEDAHEEEKKQVAKFTKKAAAILSCAILIGILIPPKQAFYAGAAQYVGEATEIDQMLLNLKTLLDQKIEELQE